MKKASKLLVAMLAVGALVTGCSGVTSSKSYTYDVSTGDSIKVALDTSSGLNLENGDAGPTIKDADGNVIFTANWLVLSELPDDTFAYYGIEDRTAIGSYAIVGNDWFLVVTDKTAVVLDCQDTSITAEKSKEYFDLLTIEKD